MVANRGGGRTNSAAADKAAAVATANKEKNLKKPNPGEANVMEALAQARRAPKEFEES